MFIMKSEGPRLRPPGLLCGVPAAGPDARETMEQSRPGVGTQWVPGLVCRMRGQRSDPQSLAGSGRGGSLRAKPW